MSAGRTRRLESSRLLFGTPLTAQAKTPLQPGDGDSSRLLVSHPRQGREQSGKGLRYEDVVDTGLEPGSVERDVAVDDPGIAPVRMHVKRDRRDRQPARAHR